MALVHAFILIALAACGLVIPGAYHGDGSGGGYSSGSSMGPIGAGGSDLFPSGQPCGAIRCAVDTQVCVHEGGCNTPGRCELVTTDGCPGVCSCDGAFLCNAYQAVDSDIQLTDDPTCLACGDARKLLLDSLPVPRGQCTWVARYRYEDLAPMGVTAVCDQGRMPRVDLATAETIASAALGPTTLGLKTLSDGVDEPAFVFWAPAQTDGGVAIVSHQGAVILAASSISGAIGSIVEPDAWLSSDLLSAPCGLPVGSPTPAVTGWDLRDGSILPSSDAASVVDALMRGPLRVVLDDLYGATIDVLLYPRSMGPFSPDHAEWVALMTEMAPGYIVE